jgi:hypothetical protein
MTEWRNKLLQLPATNSQQLLVLIYPQCLFFALNDTVTPLNRVIFKITIIRPAYPITNRFIRIHVCRRSIRSSLLHSYGWDRVDQYSWEACNRVLAVLTVDQYSWDACYRVLAVLTVDQYSWDACNRVLAVLTVDQYSWDACNRVLAVLTVDQYSWDACKLTSIAEMRATGYWLCLQLTSIAEMRATGYWLWLQYSLAFTDPTEKRRNSASKQVPNSPFIFHYMRLSVTSVNEIASGSQLISKDSQCSYVT